MKPKRVGQKPHKLIKYTPKPKPLKPSYVQRPQALDANQQSTGCGCFKVNKPKAEENDHPETTCEISRPGVQKDDKPQVDPNHRYTVCCKKEEDVHPETTFFRISQSADTRRDEMPEIDPDHQYAVC